MPHIFICQNTAELQKNGIEFFKYLLFLLKHLLSLATWALAVNLFSPFMSIVILYYCGNYVFNPSCVYCTIIHSNLAELESGVNKISHIRINTHTLVIVFFYQSRQFHIYYFVTSFFFLSFFLIMKPIFPSVNMGLHLLVC